MICQNNDSCNNLTNVVIATTENGTESSEIPWKLSTLEIGLILTLSIVTTASNLIVLLASKFASGGESPTLVFVRSLCVGDVLLGIYGMSKMMMFLNLDMLMVNFFLPESFFFTASLASVLSLLALNIDCSLKLSQPLQYLQHMDKKNIITCMVLLWNLSFIIGFLPQIGWNDQDYVLEFFQFYPWNYLVFHGVLMFISIVLNIGIITFLRNRTTQIVSNRSFMRPSTRQFQKYRRLVGTTVIDTGLWMLCCVPFYTYIGLFCQVCPLADSGRPNMNVVYFIPVFLIKSFISALVHGYRTAQIKSVIQNMSRGVSKILQNSRNKRRQNDIRIIYTNESPRSSNLSEDDIKYNGPIDRIGSTNSSATFIGVSQSTLNTIISEGIPATRDETTVL